MPRRALMLVLFAPASGVGWGVGVRCVCVCVQWGDRLMAVSFHLAEKIN